ncbi:IS5/IS1182 family transposase [Streptomyces albireticuli]|uniref:IS5/IS1182 family transposase n=1 Tax=Streptomyces albireticuli TaxID=1940 RepID=A0A2A2D3H1_9ACTN|nr:IS5/IS1182 family transposase [Streptomyces albireticuli]
MTRRQLTDEQWNFIEPFLPIGEYGPYPGRLREQFEGVIWRFRSAAQWREMPCEFGPWPTVYGRFRTWRDAGVFTALLEGVIAGAAHQRNTDLSLVSVGSTTVRAHHDAAGMCMDKEVLEALEEAAAEQEKARPKRGGPQEQNGQDGGIDTGQEERRRIRRRRRLRLKEALLGRSRGGLTSKVHLAADCRCRPLSLVLTAGQAADSPQFVPVLEKVRVRLPVGRPRTRPGAVAADKAYSSRANRSYLRKRNIKAVIPEKKDQAANRKKKSSRGGRPVSHDAGLYKERNTVERLINKLKAWRGIATRYDKTPESYLAGLHLRASMIWINDLLQTPG